MVIVCDDEDRENEGDLTMAAQFATAEKINFMAKEGRGLICLTLTPQRCGELDLPPMTNHNEARLQTAFTVSVEAREGVTTGISAADRAHTIQVAIDPESKPGDLVQPGHVFPLMARPGGVLERSGQTEAAVDLARLAHLNPSGVICEIMNDDGTMARVPDLIPYASAARAQDHHRRRPHQVPAAQRASGAPRRHGGDADQVRRLQGHRLRVRARRQPPRGHRQGRRRRQEGRAGARPLRVPHRRRVRLAALRLRRPARRGHAPHRGGGRGGRALHAPGGPRHRPHQQAQGLRAPGAGLRHRRGQRGARASRPTCATTAPARRSSPTSASRPSAS